MLNRLRGELSVLYFSCICVVILEITFISTGISYGQSNSDIEALHQAYCHMAHSLGVADEQRTESNTAEDTKSSTKDHLQENEGSSKNISTQSLVKASLFEPLSELFSVWYNLNTIGCGNDFSVSEFKSLNKSWELPF